MAKIYQETKSVDYAPLVTRVGGVLMPIAAKGTDGSIAPLHAPKDKTKTLHYVYEYPDGDLTFADGDVEIDRDYTYPGWIQTKNTTQKADDSYLNTSYTYKLNCSQGVSHSDYTSAVRRLITLVPMDMPSVKGTSVQNSLGWISNIYGGVGWTGDGGGRIWADISGSHSQSDFRCRVDMSFVRHFTLVHFPTSAPGAIIRVKIRLGMELFSYVYTAPGTSKDATLPSFPFIIEAYPIEGSWTNEVITPIIFGARATFDSLFTQNSPGEKVVEQLIDVTVPESRVVAIGANLQPGVETIKAAIGAENDYPYSSYSRSLNQRYFVYVWLSVYDGGTPIAP